MRRRPTLDDEPTRDIGPYRLAHRIAVGGMAEVYRALWPQAAGADRSVVIKRLLPSLVGDPDQRAMFEHEATLGRRIQHPNVVTLLGHGIDEGAPYHVLEYVFGVDLWRLSRWLRAAGRELSTPLALFLGTEMLAGLAAVHGARGDAGEPLHVVHHDVSPSNIFLSVHGDVKLGDLGIARAALFERPHRQSSALRAKGKLGYLSPEQVMGRPVDSRGDVYAAAVVIAELLMGQPLFGGATEIAVLLAIRDGDLTAFRAFVPRLPPRVGEALLRALEHRPERRTASAEALRDALLPHVGVPVARLRAELGALVVATMDEAGQTDRTSLAQTVEQAPDELLAMGPVDASDEVQYLVLRSGETLGPMALSTLVRAITTGEVGAQDEVRIDRRAPRLIAQVPELARHLPPSMGSPTARRRTQMAETSELYELGARSALSVLLDVLLAQDDGLLVCEHAGIRKEIYLAKGVPVFVTSNQPSELLGEVLVAKGVIARKQLESALVLMPRFEGRLGETLVAMGLIEPMQMLRLISEQVREKMLGLFTWTSGHAALYRGVEPPARGFPLKLDAWDLLVSGAARRVEAHLEDARFLGAEHRLLEHGAVDLDALGVPERLALPWMTCQSPRSLREVESLAASPLEARAAVAVLLELGALCWRGGAGRA
jgi:serine/threonine-protein kinase